MYKLCLLVAFALLSHEALGFRIKRQTEDNEQDLDDRYGWNSWNRPNRFPNQGQSQWQGRYPSQGGWMDPQFPNGGQWSYPEPQYPGNFPWQFPGPNPRPGQFPGPNQRPDQFPGPNVRPDQFPGPNQRPDQFPGPNPTPNQFPGPNPTPNQFPGQQFPEQRPTPGQNQGQGQNSGQTPSPNQTTTPTPANGSTTQSAAIQSCIRTCLVTPEYNPVCGSDNQTYDNPGRLLCAQACGVNVNQVRPSRCPNAVIPPVA